MEPKYVEAIKAGIIAGILLAVLELISQIASMLKFIDVEDISGEMTAVMGMGMIVGCGICILFIVVLLGAGALAVRMTAPMLRDLNDALVVSALSGGVAGLVWGLVTVILGVLSPLISPELESPAGKVGGSVISGFCGLICCLPAEILIGVVLALIGGAIYYAIVVKK